MFDWSMIVAIALAALGTSFLSGVFGMIGGLVLMGVLQWGQWRRVQWH